MKAISEGCYTAYRTQFETLQYRQDHYMKAISEGCYTADRTQFETLQYRQAVQRTLYVHADR
jgi:hypothetical protein